MHIHTHVCPRQPGRQGSGLTGRPRAAAASWRRRGAAPRRAAPRAPARPRASPRRTPRQCTRRPALLCAARRHGGGSTAAAPPRRRRSQQRRRLLFSAGAGLASPAHPDVPLVHWAPSASPVPHSPRRWPSSLRSLAAPRRRRRSPAADTDDGRWSSLTRARALAPRFFLWSGAVGFEKCSVLNHVDAHRSKKGRAPWRGLVSNWGCHPKGQSHEQQP